MTRLYGLPGSHPTMAAQTMLEGKGVEFRRIDLVPFLSRAIVRRGMGLPQNTVPVLAAGGRRIQGSREIARELDRLRPDPPLFPADPERRRAAEEAERWGEEELQHPIRQISLWAMRTNPVPIRSYMGRSVMGVPAAVAARLAPPFIGRGVRVNEATDEAVWPDVPSPTTAATRPRSSRPPGWSRCARPRLPPPRRLPSRNRRARQERGSAGRIRAVFAQMDWPTSIRWPSGSRM
jgi:glutathione S-transferase